MQVYLARRLIALIPALFFASLIVFVIVRLVPGSIIDMMLSQNDVGADKLSRDQLIQTLGPVPPAAIVNGQSVSHCIIREKFACLLINAARGNRLPTRTRVSSSIRTWVTTGEIPRMKRALNSVISCYGAGRLPPCTVSLCCFGRPPMRKDYSELVLLVPLFPIFLLGVLPMLLFPLLGFAGLAVIGVLVIACGSENTCEQWGNTTRT